MAAQPPVVAVRTVSERCLLGWFSRDDAIKHLTEEAVDPAFDQQSAADVWDEYQQRVEQLPDRDVTAPERLLLLSEEQVARTAFMRKHQGVASIHDVIKVDPRRLIAMQLNIIEDRAAMYSGSTRSLRDKIQHCLGTNQPQQRQLPINADVNGLRVPLPHAEFRFGLGSNGNIQFEQLARHMSVGAFDNRMLLTGGYHRAFALSSLHNPDAIERSLVVALTTDADALLSPTSPNQGLRDMVRGLRPPLFGDFFDDRLAMSLRVRKRRPEMLIQAQIKWVDDNF
jgi:hypothetical protein